MSVLVVYCTMLFSVLPRTRLQVDLPGLSKFICISGISESWEASSGLGLQVWCRFRADLYALATRTSPDEVSRFPTTLTGRL